jgi:hypothetical protein
MRQINDQYLMIGLDYLIVTLYNQNNKIENNNNIELIEYHRLYSIMYEEKKRNHIDQNSE